MNSDRDDYYRLKSEELRREQRIRDENKTNKQGAEVIIIGAAAIAATALALFLVSPGALLVALFAEKIGLSNTLVNYWGAALIISGLTLWALIYKTRSTKTGAIYYIGLCVVATLAAWQLEADNGKRIIRVAAEEFWPLKNYIPLLERNSTPINSNTPSTKNADEANKEQNQGAQLSAQVQNQANTPTQEISPKPEVEAIKIAKPEAPEPKEAIEDQDTKNISSGPSFDCSKATWQAEKIICSHEDISRLDRELSAAYKNLQANNPPSDLKQGQIAWIRNSLRKCDNQDCVRESITSRLNYLTSLRSKNQMPSEDINHLAK